MKPISIYRGIALLTIAIGAAACQNELLPSENSPEQKPGEKVTLTIRATQGGSTDNPDYGNTPQTRTEYTDGIATGGIIDVKWQATYEEIKVWGYNSADAALSKENGVVFDETSNYSADGKRIDFTGTIDKKDAYFAVYPSNIKYEDETNRIRRGFTSQKQDCTPGNEMKHLGDTYDVMLGTSRTPGTTDDFSFRHLTVMLRFDINLPGEAENITGIKLLCDNKILYTEVFIELKDGKPFVGNTNNSRSVSLSITNHTAAKTLKAYMMLAHIDLTEAQTLTVDVSTASGNAYMGRLSTTAGTTLTPGNCYTLTPTLAKVDPALTVTDLTIGKLSEALDALTSTQTFGKTKLMLSGAVSNEEFSEQDASKRTPILRFLTAHQQFTEVDLSLVTELTEIKGFNSCGKLKNIILPNAVTTLGNSAFIYCSALTSITLPASVSEIGNYAFKSCTALQSILFEGTKTVGTDLTLSNIIVDDTPANLAVFLPCITAESVARSYQPNFSGKNVYYNYKGDYDTATAAQKVDVVNYTLCPTN